MARDAALARAREVDNTSAWICYAELRLSQNCFFDAAFGYSNAGKLYREIGRTGDAIEMYLKSYHLFSRMEDDMLYNASAKARHAFVCAELGWLYSHDNERAYTEAVPHFEKAIRLTLDRSEEAFCRKWLAYSIKKRGW